MSKMFYRIHTEDSSLLPELVTQYFDCFALVRGTGYWRGKPESSATIEIIADVIDEVVVKHVASRICEILKQEAVYVTSHPVDLTDVRVVKFTEEAA